MFGDEQLIKIHKARGTQVANIIVFCFVLVFIRLWYLQVYKGELYHKFSIQNRLRKEVVRAPRGSSIVLTTFYLSIIFRALMLF